MIDKKILSSGNIDRYLPKDENLFLSNNIQRNFGQEGDYVEYHVYDVNNNLLLSINDFKNYKPSNLSNLNSDGTLKEIKLNPPDDLIDIGFTNGEYITQYNFFRRKISSNIDFRFFIKEISSDRTEIRVSSNLISNDNLESQIINLINEINDSQYFKDYLLNFGDNNNIVCINVGLDKNTNPYNVLLKLYEPLPERFDVKDTFFIVDEIIQSKIYNISLNEVFYGDNPLYLKGPNFDIDVNNYQNDGTDYNNYNSLLSSNSKTSYQNVISLLEDKGIEINVDYSNFSNFIHFSSVTERIQNFYYKVQLIELYNSQSLSLDNVNNSIPYQISNKNLLQDKINNIISKFDGYEYYLYFESGSKTYPKSGSLKPYNLLPSTSSAVINWISSSLQEASLYDSENPDNLEYLVPSFIRNDKQNEPYLLFLNMIGQHFDNLWLYINSITDLYKANNNLYKGISKDLISEALKSLGIKIYSSNADINLFEYLIGSTESGSYNFPVDPTGSYHVQLITSSLQTLPKEDQSKEVLKRIYHNLPYLLKTKGTERGLKALISCFGIPDTILRVIGYGGTDSNSEYDLEYNVYDSSTTSSSIHTLNQIDGGFRRSTNKIRIQNNIITGSVLSPLINIEKTSGSNLTQDLHFIEVSLSPTFEIDNDILNYFTGSVIFDNYIGNPGDLYNDNYPDLENLNKEYFKNWLNSRSFNYYDYIRIIKFFDNSLFRMLKDFVPMRTNLLTGLTIQPHLLERHKIKQYPINIESLNISCSMDMGNVSEDRSYIYNKLDNKKAFYNGEYNEEISDYNNDFIGNNENEYLKPECEDNNFKYSDFNILFNNISSSIISQIRKTEDISNKEILNFSEINDCDLSLTSYLRSRYEGEKVSSRLYNFYTEGDASYGKTAAIDKYVNKVALFTEIVSSSFLRNRNNVIIKYLVDKSGNLTELNRYNKNWEEVQRTFISDTNLIVSLFDNQKYSNQKTLDGEKSIFNSGYSYYPTLYFSSSDGYMYFSLFEESDKDFSAINKDGNIIGSPVYYSRFSSGSHGEWVIYNIFDQVVKNELNYYTPGRANNNFSYYTIPDVGSYQFEGNVDMNIVWNSGGSLATYTFEIWSGSQNGSNIEGERIYSQTVNLNTSLYIYEVTGSLTGSNPMAGPPAYMSMGPVAIRDSAGNNVGSINKNDAVTIETRVVRTIVPPYGNPQAVWVNFIKYNGNLYRFDGYLNSIDTPRPVKPFGSLSVNKTIPISTPSYNYFNPGDNIIFRLVQNYLMGSGVVRISGGSLKANLVGDINQDPYAVSPFVQPITGSDQLTFTPNISSFYNYLYLPQDSSIMYDVWGDVDYPFTINEQDIIVIQLGENNISEHTITKVNNFISHISVNVNPAFPVGINIVNKFLLLKRVEDETNVIFRFNKRPGNTSYGFIIPYNLSSEVLDNIDIIAKEVKQKLIEDGNNIGLDIDGGTY